MLINNILKKINYFMKILRNIYYKKVFNLPKNHLLRVYGKLIIKNPEKIVIGNNVALNDFVYLQGDGEIFIGDNVVISAFSKIISTGLEVQSFIDSEKSSEKENKHNENSVYINKNCWIGSGVIILPGVKITGENVIIGAGTIVNKSISESNCLVVGNPAKIIKRYT